MPANTTREPLQDLSTNHRTPPSASSSSSASKGKRPYPIFARHSPSDTPTRAGARSDAPPSSPLALGLGQQYDNAYRRKRVRAIFEDPSSRTREKDQDKENIDDHEVTERERERDYRPPSPRGISRFFPASSGGVNSSSSLSPNAKVALEINAPTANADEVEVGVWKRPRRRFGVGPSGNRMAYRGLEDTHTLSTLSLTEPHTPYLSTLVHSKLPFCPTTPPSRILLPSLQPPTYRPRDFAPPLAIAFNSVAKHYDAQSARSVGKRRMIAIAGEEGGIRIVDVDEGLGSHPEGMGWWWRAHSNAVFDIKWSADDSRVLTASGDQTTRLHALTTPTPTLLSTLRGHTSSIKTTVFFDPTRSHGDPSTYSSVVASGGRDGNILIFDLRCQGRREKAEADQAGSAAPMGSFVAQRNGDVLDPVMSIKGAHGDGSRRGQGFRTATRSVTSLVALQAMPGILASGGSYDGVVKLWDLRFPAPTSRSATPRPTYNAYGVLADPTLYSANPSRRPRSINGLAESPTTGDLFTLTGDSKCHILQPSAYLPSSNLESQSEQGQDHDYSGILPKTLVHPDLMVSNFYLKVAVSPDGRYVSAGSARGGAGGFCWDTEAGTNDRGEVVGHKMDTGAGGQGASAVDWGYDMYAACGDDCATRFWRSDKVAGEWLKVGDSKAKQIWAGATV